jgi:hypothetical protein
VNVACDAGIEPMLKSWILINNHSVGLTQLPAPRFLYLLRERPYLLRERLYLLCARRVIVIGCALETQSTKR